MPLTLVELSLQLAMMSNMCFNAKLMVKKTYKHATPIVHKYITIFLEKSSVDCPYMWPYKQPYRFFVCPYTRPYMWPYMWPYM